MSPVPAPRFRGGWSRLSLTTATGTDTATAVTWLQGTRLYIDLRQCPGRPDFEGCGALAELDDAALAWLASQQGFAGHLEWTPGLCWWQRHIHFQPPGPLPDAGRMSQRPDGLVVEQGVFAEHTEEWLRTAEWSEDSLGLKFAVEGAPGEAALRQGFLVALSDTFMFALDRPTRPELRPGLYERAFRGRERAALIEALDFEISLGRRHGRHGPWEIERSTLPHREGCSLLDFDALGAAGSAPPLRHPALDGRRVYWLIEERGQAFDWLDPGPEA